jgi:hypothetical protein
MLALLDRNSDEALFWTYELYYSGFKQETIDYLYQTYEFLYSFDNDDLEDFILKLESGWQNNNTLDHLAGSIAITLCGRKYRIDHFIKEILHIVCKSIDNGIDKSTEKKSRKLKVYLKPSDIEIYKTIESNGTAFNVLKKACRYPLRKYVNNIFQTFVPENIREIYYYHWQYYAVRSWVWKERAELYNAYLNHETKQLVFSEVESDSDEFEQEFYKNWGYEPDEQSLIVQSKSIGTGFEKQISLKEFCSKYGAEIITKKIKRKKINIDNNQKLANSIIYT